MAQMQPYRSRYGDTITDLLARRGDIAAQGALASGQIWGNAVGNLGQIAGGAIQDYAQIQQQKQQAEAMKARDMAIAEIFNSEAATDPTKLFHALTRVTDPKSAMDMAEGAASLMKISTAKDPKEALAVLPGLARGFMAAPEALRPGLWGVVRQSVVSAGLVKAEEMPEQYDPETAKGYIDFALGLEKPEQTKLAPGERLVQGREVIAEGAPKVPTAPNVGSFEDYVVQKFGPRPTPPQIAQARREYQQADNAPQQPSYQAKEVLDDNGQPVMANFDSRTGRYVNAQTGQPIKAPRPVPSAQAQADVNKFKTAGPVLQSVSELSERINTLQGVVAKASGEAEKAKAQLNLNDDVAEYQALISGFTPLVARALGHTGVLTEQDVQSVRELFPKPGDSKSLRDRKVARVNRIMSALQGGPQAAATTVGRFKVEVE